MRVLSYGFSVSDTATGGALINSLRSSHNVVKGLMKGFLSILFPEKYSGYERSLERIEKSLRAANVRFKSCIRAIDSFSSYSELQSWLRGA